MRLKLAGARQSVHDNNIRMGWCFTTKRQVLSRILLQFSRSQLGAHGLCTVLLFIVKFARDQRRLIGRFYPIRLAASAQARLRAAPREQSLFENVVGQLNRHRPSNSARLRPPQIVLDRAARPQRAADLARAHPVMGAAATCIVIVAWSALSSPASPTSSSMRKGWLPESLTRRVVVRPFAPLSRGGGRLQIGIPAGINSEYLAGMRRNLHFPCALLGSHALQTALLFDNF